MTNDELRAAAAAVTVKAEAGDYSVTAIIKREHAAIVLADAWLAEHPADDADAVTVEWLVSIGFKSRGEWWDIPTPPGEVYCYGDQAGGFVFKYEGHDDTGGGAAPLPPMPTRGHVRRLLAALGVASVP